MNTYKVVSVGYDRDEEYAIEADSFAVDLNGGVTFYVRALEEWPTEVAHFARPRVIELVKDEPADTQSPPNNADDLLREYAAKLTEYDKWIEQGIGRQRQVEDALDRWRAAAGIAQDEGGN